jgi:hypothetical protein
MSVGVGATPVGFLARYTLAFCMLDPKQFFWIGLCGQAAPRINQFDLPDVIAALA